MSARRMTYDEREARRDARDAGRRALAYVADAVRYTAEADAWRNSAAVRLSADARDAMLEHATGAADVAELLERSAATFARAACRNAYRALEARDAAARRPDPGIAAADRAFRRSSRVED